VLVGGLTAVQGIPSARFWMETVRAGGLAAHEPASKGPLRDDPEPVPGGSSLAAWLDGRLRGRVLSRCGSMDDDLAVRGLAAVGGHGGVYRAGYATVANFARGLYGEDSGAYGTGGRGARGGVRSDLAALLDAEYLVSCDAPDPSRWVPVEAAGMNGVYRGAGARYRAVWTCAPLAATRSEVEFTLRRYRYDAALTLSEPRFLIHVRWTPGLSEGDRERAEGRLHLAPERFLGQRTWEYELADPSPSGIEAIVTSPRVEDTAGVDRARFVPRPERTPVFDEPQTEWLMGGSRCDAPVRASVLTRDTSDGRLVAVVDAPADGLVFLSETYWPERTARVDGRPVQPLRVNLAFTGIPVTRGRHRVELGYDQRAFRLGAAVSVLTLLVWMAAARRESRRAARAPAQRTSTQPISR
jgi:hypothetical protein